MKETYLKIKPIQMTKYNEILKVNEENNDILLNFNIGIHKYCGGIIDLINISDINKAIVCRHCKLRIVIPASIETHSELREELKQKIWIEAGKDIVG